MSRLTQKFCILLAISILSGCAAMQAGQLKSSVTSPDQSTQLIVPSQLDMLMQYYEFLQEKTEEELAQEFNTVKANFMRSGSNGDRIRYILLLSLPNSDFRNISDALGLLIEWPQNTSQSTSMDSFRKLLTQLLTEQQHLNSTVNNFAQKLNAAEKYAEELQKQVEDIKDMEKSLIRRESHSILN